MKSKFFTLRCSLSILTLICVAASVARASFTDADKTAFVVAHNRLREAAFPSAVGMRFIIWDANLERLAVAAAQKCNNEHNYDGEYKGLGENIYKGWRTDGHEVTLGWYSEKGAYNPAMTECKGCGHYFQVMSAAIEKIGCGIKRDCTPSVHMIYCEYSSGNSYFIRGPACSACPATMPLCLNGLCVSKDMATNPVMKEVDPTVTTAAAFKCRLICKNCGKLVTDASTNVCRCDCSGTGATGDLCETKSASSTATCSLCTGSSPCQNSGTEDTSDPLKCKCKCTAGFLGDKCETLQGQFDNSVKLVLGAATEFKFVKWVIMPPVSRSLFNSKIWATLQLEMAKAVNKFCRADAVSFVKCCPGKNFPADPSSIAAAEHVKPTDFNFIESSVGHTFDTFNMLIFATVSSSSPLCAPATSPTYLPSLVLLPAIKSEQAAISAQLSACCGNLALKEAASTDLGALTGPNQAGGSGGSGGPSGSGGSSGSGNAASNVTTPRAPSAAPGIGTNVPGLLLLVILSIMIWS